MNQDSDNKNQKDDCFKQGCDSCLTMSRAGYGRKGCYAHRLERENEELQDQLDMAQGRATYWQEKANTYKKVLEQIASGILPNGDHVEGSVYEFANEVLNKKD